MLLNQLNDCIDHEGPKYFEEVNAKFKTISKWGTFIV